MKVQLICRSDKDPADIEILEEPFDLETVEGLSKPVVLVPNLEYYDYVSGQLFIENIDAEVICIPPPSEYKPPVGKVPYALVTDDYVARCDLLYPDDIHLNYYFRPVVEQKVIYD